MVRSVRAHSFLSTIHLSSRAGGFVNNVSALVLCLESLQLPRNIDYWDSFWITEGLIQSRLFDIVNDTLQNFMDEIESFGFIPNGGRRYCTPLLSVFSH